MIQCFPVSNKGLKEDFLIFSRQWHDGLPCPVKKGKPGGELIYLIFIFNFSYSSIPIVDRLILKLLLIVSTDVADPRATMPSLRLVNKASLDRILRAEIYVNPSDGQLRAAHLILGYSPISSAV